MKCKSLLLLLSVMWAVCSSTLEARDLLVCEYNPSERTVSGRLGTRKRSVSAMYRRYKKASNYEDVHPSFKALIEQNRDNYRYYGGRSLLYLSEQDGFGLYEFGGKILLYRTRVFADDAAWTYQKEPALNPFTGRSWIELSASELKTVLRGGKKMDEPDQQFLKDVLSILNENFHYFYGMQLVDLGRDPHVDRAQLMGKFMPPKIVFFGKQVDMLDLSNYSEQQVSLYRQLGHPVYNYEGLIHPNMNAGVGSTCSGRGISYMTFRNDTGISMAYFNQAAPSEVEPSMLARAVQMVAAGPALTDMVKGLEKICEERGGNPRSLSMNKTPLTRALCLVYQKTKWYAEEVSKHPYVANSFNENEVGEGVNHLYDVVSIKGLTEERTLSRAGSHSSSRIRASSSKNKRRTQRSARERN